MTRSGNLLAGVAAAAMLWAGGAVAQQAAAQHGLAGSYLAARQASTTNDFRSATRFYARVLARDRSNIAIMEGLILSYVGLGDFKNAATVSRALVAQSPGNQIGQIVLLAEAIDTGGDISTTVEGAGDLVSGLIRAWENLDRGRMSEALDQFDKVIATEGFRDFGLYHKALALALVGDLEGAMEVFAGEGGAPVQPSRGGVIAQLQILSQLERNDEALALIDRTLPGNSDPLIQDMRNRLDAGETLPLDVVTSAQDGQAEVFFTLAAALQGEANDTLTLLYSRIAEYIRPSHVDALLLSAGILEGLGQYDLATESYNRVPRQSPVFPMAEIGRAEALYDSGKPDAAVEVLEQLAKSYPEVQAVHTTLGDILRREERHAEATLAYNRAIDLIQEPTAADWVVYYTRGITLEREDRWEEAEADFRKALELRPDQPLVLNYLGYSFVEKGENLIEALDMIERAVAERPNDGFIADSLGWALYRMGRFEEAVGPMERAVELTPVDPLINDHLGDVLWMVGRKREAEFQWRRAISFGPEEEELRRIRRKLEIGLSAVLEEEGAKPVAVAKDGG